MGNPYTSVSVVNYNASPPPDDGTNSAANEVTWAKPKEKLGDPLKTAIETVDTNVTAAFAKIFGANVSTTATNYTVLAGDQGKLIRVTAAVTITTPAAVTVGVPFIFAVKNEHSAAITIDGNASETIDGSATYSLSSGQTITILTDGTNWFTVTSATPPGLVLLASASPSAAASVDIVSAITATYETYLLVYNNLRPATDDSVLYLRTSTDNGSTFDTGTGYAFDTQTYSAGTGTAVINTSGGGAQIELTDDTALLGVGNLTTEGVSGHVWIYSPLSTAHYTLITGESAYVDQDATLAASRTAGARTAAADVDAVQLLFDSGNITSGEVRFYGVRNT